MGSGLRAGVIIRAGVWVGAERTEIRVRAGVGGWGLRVGVGVRVLG